MILRRLLLLVGLGCAALMWVMVCALPVVVSASALVVASAHVLGKQAMLPSCVVRLSLLSVNCTGRLFGWWMDKPYWDSIRKRIWARLSGQGLFTYSFPEVLCKKKLELTGIAVAIRSPLFCKNCVLILLTCGIVALNAFTVFIGFLGTNVTFSEMGSHPNNPALDGHTSHWPAWRKTVM
ncbi:uncharacterized protein LOC129590193 [Paramacrobiotus metropolitanus]|uniref:uncharacterized protein LOC129590193 n=1 Tax=Paramacrobiotus metropolitanus TaxID=2943436 RepID=UPI002446587B|nr:uncharacterized protein LOC129590193 [Paramacrobiotus metropolitanus]